MIRSSEQPGTATPTDPDERSIGFLATVWHRVRPEPGSTQGWRSLGLIVILAGLIISVDATNPVFFSSSNVDVLLSNMVMLGIASVGMTLLIISANVDLSIGSMFALVACITGLSSLHINPDLAFFLAIPIAGGFGLINGILVWRVKISPLVITLGALTLLQGLAELVTNGNYVQNLPQAFTYFGQGYWLGVSIPVVLLVLVVLVGHLVLSRTTLGRHIYAIGGNREAAELAGIRVRRVVIGLFVVNAMLIGLAAALETSRFDAASIQFGTNLALQTITAVILGGVAFTGGEGSIFGVILAVSVLTMMNAALISFNVNPFWSDLLTGALLIVAVSLDQLTQEQRERYRKTQALREFRAAHPVTAGAPSTPNGPRL